MIGLIDYGVGNIKAFANIYRCLNIPYKIVSNVTDFTNITKIILPGVGAFDHAMRELNASGIRETLDIFILEKKIPILGICVGMQMLADSSEEGNLPGLGWIGGRVKKIDLTNLKSLLPLPHMGWNCMTQIINNPLFNELEQNARLYFLHSYHFDCEDRNNIIAVTDYGDKFSCVVNDDNIYGVQCHPEKSHQNGITMLKNFWEL